MHAQIKARQQAQQLQDALQDLHAWEQSIQAKDEALRRRSETTTTATTSHSDAPPEPVPTHPRPPANAASHTFDHYQTKWDNFDVDAALASSDDEQTPMAGVPRDKPRPPPAPPTHANENTHQQPLLRPIQSRTLPKKQPPRASNNTPTTALEWKDHGNEAFRNRHYTTAIERYTRSLELQPTCVAYANRAMARLKLGQHALVVEDATMALGMDAGYVKAWQRRAAAHIALGNTMQAAGDLEHAVLLEPENR